MMNSDIVNSLAEMLRQAPKGEQSTFIHLFGIRFGNELAGYKLDELRTVCEEAGAKASWGTELRKMVKLSKYVVEKT